jgi:tRNA A-37 threonylcarbamoyl transferase component Bud32
VLAHGVERRFGVVVRSFLLLRLVPNTRDLRLVVRNTSPGERDDLWEPVGRMVAALHATRLFHRDLTARNVLVRRADGAVDVHLIDCPRAERGWFPPRRAFLRRSDLFRLGRSILKAGGDDDEVRRLLEAAGVARPEIVRAMIGRSLRRGGNRTTRTQLWMIFGV